MPKRQILTNNSIDMANQRIVIGQLLATGGYGAIYEIADDESKVIKIEPKQSGGLFCEQRIKSILEESKINQWLEHQAERQVRTKSIKSLPLPRWYNVGTCIINEQEYRYLIMSKLKPCKFFFNDKQTIEYLLWGLQYLHESGFIHGDLHEGNILLHRSDLCIIDFSCSFKFNKDMILRTSRKKEFPRGTMMYASLDAHDYPSCLGPRGDLGNLLFLILHEYMTFPWEQFLKTKKMQKDNLDLIYKLKLQFWDEITHKDLPVWIKKFKNEIDQLEFYCMPDYDKLREIVRTG